MDSNVHRRCPLGHSEKYHVQNTKLRETNKFHSLLKKGESELYYLLLLLGKPCSLIQRLLTCSKSAIKTQTLEQDVKLLKSAT